MILSTAVSVMGQIERLAASFQGKGWGSTSVKQELAAVSRFLPGSPAIVVDIGANIGNYSFEVRERYPNVEIHIFEPAEVNQNKLRARFADDANVNLVSAAVNEASGTSTLYADVGGSGLASLSKRRLDHFGITFEVSSEVRTVRFEDYWKLELKKRPIDLVKLDIEGHEMAALRGFGDALSQIRVVQFEFGGCNIDTRTYFQDFWYFFMERGFKVFRITPFGPIQLERYLESDERFQTTNYLAVSAKA